MTTRKSSPISEATTRSRYEALLQSCEDAVLIVDARCRILDASVSAVQLFGGVGNQLATHDASQLFDGGRLADLLDERAVETTLHSAVALDSRRSTFPARLRIARDISASPPTWVLQVRNLTDLQSSQADLFAAREAWAQCFNALPDHICLLDLSGAILKANTSMKNRFEPIHGKLEGTDYRLIYCGTATPDPQPPCAAVLCGGPSVTLETALPAVPGWFVVSSYPLHDAEGALWGAVSVVKDVTQRRRAQLELDRLFETSLDVSCIMDRFARLRRVNRAYTEAFGVSEDGDSQSLLDIVHADDVQATTERLARLRQGEQMREFRNRCRTITGDYRWFSWSIPAPADDETAVCVVGRDVTERELSEQFLRVARQKAEDANAARSRFLATVSHEMRTPLHAINGALELLEAASDQQSALLRTCQESATSLRRLIDDILDCSQIESGRLNLRHAPLQIPDVVAQCARRFKETADARGITFSTVISATVPETVMGDAERLIQVLTNLLSNALKFTSEGSVKLVVTHERQTESVGQLCFEVADTGVGIAPEQMDRIFQIFQQADNSIQRPFGGLGLGLWISRRIVESMEGSIEVDSEPGKGTRFRVLLPAKVSTEPLIELSPDSERFFSETRLRILLADDDGVGVRITRAMLERRHHSVTCCPDGQSVLTALAENPTGFDLILMDLMMPGIDGVEAARQIRHSDAAYSEIPILAASAHAMPDATGLCQEAGINGYLSKPFSRRQLEDAITVVIGQSVPDNASPIDARQLLQRCNGDIDLIQSLPEIFRPAAETDLTTIRTALEEDDSAALRQAAHRLKGTLQHLCAIRASELITLIHDRLLQDPAESLRLLSQLESEILLVQDALLAFRQSR